jgi:hypothetical protein
MLHYVTREDFGMRICHFKASPRFDPRANLLTNQRHDLPAPSLDDSTRRYCQALIDSLDSLDSLHASSDEQNQLNQYLFVSLFFSLDPSIHDFLLSTGQYRRIAQCLIHANTPTELNFMILAVTTFIHTVHIALPRT